MPVRTYPRARSADGGLVADALPRDCRGGVTVALDGEAESAATKNLPQTIGVYGLEMLAVAAPFYRRAGS